MKTKFLLFVSLLTTMLFISCSTNEPTDDAANPDATSKTITTDDVVANSEIDASVDDISIIAEDQFSLQQSITSRTSTPPKSMLHYVPRLRLL